MKLHVRPVIVVALLAAVALAPKPAAAQAAGPSTPAELVATYKSLADGILSLKRTEEDLCRSILAAAHAHGRVALGRAQAALKGGDAKAAQAAVEALAASVGQLGNEGDNSVAAIRKQLLDGGHHHNAAGEAQGIFDEGFVIVTKAAKKPSSRRARDRRRWRRAEGRRPRRRVGEGQGRVDAELVKPAQVATRAALAASVARAARRRCGAAPPRGPRPGAGRAAEPARFRFSTSRAEAGPDARAAGRPPRQGPPPRLRGRRRARSSTTTATAGSTSTS